MVNVNFGLICEPCHCKIILVKHVVYLNPKLTLVQSKRQGSAFNVHHFQETLVKNINVALN